MLMVVCCGVCRELVGPVIGGGVYHLLKDDFQTSTLVRPTSHTHTLTQTHIDTHIHIRIQVVVLHPQVVDGRTLLHNNDCACAS